MLDMQLNSIANISRNNNEF